MLRNAGVTSIDTFDYATFLKERGAPSGDAFSDFPCPLKEYWIRYWVDTNTDFWQRMVSELKAYAGDRPFSISCNNTSLQLWEPYHRQFDFAISELLLETANPVHISERADLAKSVGKIQVFGSPKTRGQPVRAEEKMLLIRKVFATAYAKGMLAMLPWDVFDQSADGTSRYFVRPEDIADLSAFVRAFDWNGYTEVATFGTGLPETDMGLVTEGGSAGVYGFVHLSKNTEEPILIHLVDWGFPVGDIMEPTDFPVPGGEKVIMYDPAKNLNRTQAAPFTLVLPRANFDQPDQVAFRLLTPTDYDAQTHAAASAKGNWKSLILATPLTTEITDTEIRLSLPALNPWGIVEITRIDDSHRPNVF